LLSDRNLGNRDSRRGRCSCRSNRGSSNGSRRRRRRRTLSMSLVLWALFLVVPRRSGGEHWLCLRRRRVK
jgi:hypothetical protein